MNSNKLNNNRCKLNSFYEPGPLDDLPDELRDEFQSAFRAFTKRWIEAKTGKTQEKNFLEKLHELLAIKEAMMEVERDEES